MRFWPLLACLFAAGARADTYTLPQALSSGSFIDSTKDILSVVAPSLDPQLKLAAQAQITLSDYKRAHDVLVENMFRQTAPAKVIETRRVVAFSIGLNVISSDRVGTVTDFMAQWAARAFKSARSDVLVTEVSNRLGTAQSVFNVTIAAPARSDWDALFETSPNNALALIGLDDPTCANTLEGRGSLNGCGGICTALIGSYSSPVTASLPCPQNIFARSMGYRYVIDFFSTFSTPNSVTARRLQDTEKYLPTTTLQYKLPYALSEPGSVNNLPILAGTLGASAVLVGLMVCIQYRNNQPPENVKQQ